MPNDEGAFKGFRVAMEVRGMESSKRSRPARPPLHGGVSIVRISSFLRHSTVAIRHYPVPYKYLEDVGTADIAFEATGRDLPELFTVAADAMTNVMIENLEAIQPRETRQFQLNNEKIDMLLFDFLQELIYLKDADRLLLRIRQAQIREKDGHYFLEATVVGEPLDAVRHHQRADVKAVTLHQFQVAETDGGWKATVILDI
jgi:SHS2 domain-containing protein